MRFEVKVTSKEFIKPSSPTPRSLAHYKLSFLDQVTSDVYNTMIYFYALNDIKSPFKTLDDISNQLKQSLSELLTHYYPLAGRADYDNTIIDCNDEGVPFVEARVNCQLSDVLRNSDFIDMSMLVPFELGNLTDISMGVKLNVFQCGGIAIGVCISHKIGDALSFFIVIKAWIALARGDSKAVHAHFRSSELFPPLDSSLSCFNTRIDITRERVAKRFVFDNSKLEDIRAKYEDSSLLANERRSSRVETLSFFIYSRFLAAIRDESKPSGLSNKLYQLTHTINIRPRLDPGLPEYAFGNYYHFTKKITTKDTLDDEGDCHKIMKKIREAIKGINKESLKQVRIEIDNKESETLKEKYAKFEREDIITCGFTSLCRFPLYDADFGWGNPIWAAPPPLTFRNLVVLMDAKNGNGIEVFIHLKEEHMARLIADKEFLQYASITTGSQLT